MHVAHKQRRTVLTATHLHRYVFRALVLITVILPLSGKALTPEVRGVPEHLKNNIIAHIGELRPVELSNTIRLSRILNTAVNNAVQPFGYYQADTSFNVSGENLLIDVEPGPPTLISEVDIVIEGEATTDDRFHLAIRNSGVEAGAQLNHPAYEDLREELQALARELGYFEARYTQAVLRVNPDERSAQPHLHLDSGPRYRFGQLELSGTDVNAHLLLAKARFAEGEFFSQSKLSSFEQYLMDTGYFHSVQLSKNLSPGKLVDVAIELTDVNVDRIEVGVGASTDTSFRFRFNHLNPRINGAGHSIESSTQISKVEQSIDARYRIPLIDSFKNFYQFSAGARSEDVQDTQTTSISLGARKLGQLGEDWNWSYGLSAEYERFQIGEEPEATTQYLLPGISFDYTSLESGNDPRSGHHYSADIAWSTPGLGAKTQFTRLRGSGKWLLPLGSGRTTVLTRLDVGVVVTDELESVPASLRFSTGGDSSIRGFDYESLSTRDSQGNLAGSKYLAVGSVELSYLFRPSWRCAVFVDSGSAFTTGADDVYQSAGLGVRWLSPVGQIRVDLAAPIGSSEHSGVRLHISMGPPL
ncbi:MAG: translocation and assembly module TamA [Halieaceae bacterium]|jgi:translocation and assembly module TamA